VWRTSSAKRFSSSTYLQFWSICDTGKITQIFGKFNFFGFHLRICIFKISDYSDESLISIILYLAAGITSKVRTNQVKRKRMKSIWDSWMWIRLDLEPAQIANEEFQSDRANRAHFGSQLLLYDRIIIPTKDFGIVPILANWCGLDLLKHLLETKSLAFVWHEFHVAYAGNGGGLYQLKVEEPNTGWENSHQIARWAPMELSAEAQINNMFSSLKTSERSDLCSLLLQNSTKAEYSEFKKETIKDLSTIGQLNRFLYEHEPNIESPININRLSGIESNKIRILNRKTIKDGIDLVLRVAEINTEIGIAATLEDCDLGLSSGTAGLLGEKMKRSGAAPSQIEKFISVLSLEQIPDNVSIFLILQNNCGCL
jgi:hypothetical protein